jgi:DNA-binding CsgD family transcriptional regulator
MKAGITKKGPFMDSRFFFAVFLTVLSAFTASKAAQAQDNYRFYIDLQKFPLYIKADFNPSDAVSPDLQDGSWQAREQWPGAVIRRLGLPGFPKRAFLSPWGRPEQEWTFALPFTMDADAPLFPCLYLASIGVNWEIYLNGTLLKREMHMSGGRITEKHSERDVIVPINSSLLQKGANILAFRIAGDPTDYTTGFIYKTPSYIADYDYVMRSHSEIDQIIIITILAILGIYHFLFFAIFRDNRYNLVCGFFSLGMGLYYLWRTHWIYQIIPNTDVVVRLEFFTVYFMILALMAYTDKLCNGRYSNGRYFIVTKIYGVFCLILAVSQLFFSRTYGSETLIVWQLVSIPAMVWFFIYNIILPFTRELKNGKKFADTFVNTYPGNLLIAVLMCVLTVVIDLVDSFALHYSLDLTSYSMVVFALSVTLMLFRMSVIKTKELKEKSALLEKSTNPASSREKVFNLYGLTEREKEIARLIVEGLNNTDIGGRLFISNSTIAFHVTNIFRKFGITDGKNKGRAMFMAKLIN